MSNLSELLPSGGGQNAVDFVASGTLSSGQTVALKSDGTVEAVTETAVPASVGSAAVFETAACEFKRATFDSLNNKVVIVYADEGNSGYGTAIVGTVSGTSISFGTAVIFYSGDTNEIAITFDTSNNKVVVAYSDGVNANTGKAIVGTVSGTSISFGSVTTLAILTYNNSATFDSSSNKVVIAYRDGGNSNYGTGIVGTVSGTSISFGSPVVFESAASVEISATFDSLNNKVVIAYLDGGNSYRGTAVVGSVSGTAISFGTAVVFESASSNHVSATYDSTNNKVVVAYQGSSSYGTAIAGTVSGTSISFGTKVVFEAATSTWISATFNSTSNNVIIAYQDGGNSGYGTVVSGAVSGTSISFGTPLVFEAASSYEITATYDSNSNKAIIAYNDGGNANYGTGIVYTDASTSSNNTDFIGLTAEAISDTATGAVNVYGGINEAQSGLTIAADYYVQDDGTLSTTVSSVKVGQAISATTINMMDLT